MRLRLALAVLASALAVGAARQVYVGKNAIVDCDVALDKGDYVEAVAFARSAAEALLPGSPYPARGYERLDKLGRDAEARGDDALATSAWRAMHAAASETRAFGYSTDAWRARAAEGLLRAASRGTPRPDAAIMTELVSREDTPSSSSFFLLAAAACAIGAGAVRVLRTRAPARRGARSTE